VFGANKKDAPRCVLWVFLETLSRPPPKDRIRPDRICGVSPTFRYPIEPAEYVKLDDVLENSVSLRMMEI